MDYINRKKEFIGDITQPVYERISIHSDADKRKMDIFIPKKQQTETQLTQYTITVT